MEAALVLLLLELAVAAVCLLATRGNLAQTSVALLVVTAPLELYRTTIGNGNVSLFRLSLLVAVVVAGAHVVRTRRLRVLADRRAVYLVGLYVLLLGLLAASMILKPTNTSYGLRLAANVGLGLVCLTAIAQLTAQVSVVQMLEWCAWASILPILAASWQAIAPTIGADPSLPYLSSLPLTAELDKSRDAVASLGELGTRLRGTFADPNHFGAYLAFTSILAAALLLRAVTQRDGRGMVSYSALALANGTILVTTYSRSAWLAAAVGVVVLCGLTAASLRTSVGGRALRRGAVAAAVVLVLLAIPLAPAIRDRLSPSAETNQASNRDHATSIDAGLTAFKEHPIDGIGVGGLGQLLDQGPRTSGAHSSYVTVAAELGIAGLAVLLISALLSVTGLLQVLRVAPHPDHLLVAGLLGGYAGFLVANALYDLWFDDWHFVALGIVGLAAPAAILASAPATRLRHQPAGSR